MSDTAKCFTNGLYHLMFTITSGRRYFPSPFAQREKPRFRRGRRRVSHCPAGELGLSGAGAGKLGPGPRPAGWRLRTSLTPGLLLDYADAFHPGFTNVHETRTDLRVRVPMSEGPATRTGGQLSCTRHEGAPRRTCPLSINSCLF